MPRASASKTVFDDAAESPTRKIRRTQRAPTSCIQCARRKSKCSRTIPCAQCIGRAVGDQCRREDVLVKGKELAGASFEMDMSIPTTVEELVQETKELRQRIALLEAQKRDREKEFDKQSTLSIEDHEQNDLERMGISCMLLELNVERVEGTAKSFWASPTDQPLPSECESAATVNLWAAPEISSLPSDEVCTTLITFAIDQLGWLYATVHGPTFMQQHWDFLALRASKGPLCMGPRWLAFYFSQMALALHHKNCMSTGDIEVSDPRRISKIWFDSAVQLLVAAGLFTAPDQYSLHTIANLSCIFHAYGTPFLGTTLLAAAVRMAQALRYDHLPPEPLCEGTTCTHYGLQQQHLASPMGVKDREIRRRLWWFLLYRDWVAFPSGFPYSVAPEYIRVPSPLNLSDEALTLSGPIWISPPSQPTLASFHIARTRIAIIVHKFFLEYRGMDRRNPARLYLVKQTDKLLEQVFDDMPYFSAKVPFDLQPYSEAFRAWLPSARHLVMSLTAHKRLLLFRDFFALAFSNPKYNLARDECVSRALEIARIRKDYPQPQLGIEETTSHYLAAVNVLALDLVYSPPSRPRTKQEQLERRRDIEDLVLVIRTSETFEGHATEIINQVETLLSLDDVMRSSESRSADAQEEWQTQTAEQTPRTSNAWVNDQLRGTNYDLFQEIFMMGQPQGMACADWDTSCTFDNTFN